MKELEKTKRISISAVLFLLVLIIGFITYKKPKHIFDKNAKTTLNELVTSTYIITYKNLSALDPASYQLVDIRDYFEYTKGAMNNAVNIPTNLILEKSSIDFFNNLKKEGKTIIVYGKTPEEANGAWLLLYQLGYENIKLLCVEIQYTNNTIQVKNYALERPSENFAQVMLSTENTNKAGETTKPKESRKVIQVRKKKKRAPEGGC